MSTATHDIQGPSLPDFDQAFRDYQKRVLAFQKSAFDAQFDAMVSFQEQHARFGAQPFTQHHFLLIATRQILRLLTIGGGLDG